MALLHSVIGPDTDIDPRNLKLYIDLGLKLIKDSPSNKIQSVSVAKTAYRFKYKLEN